MTSNESKTINIPRKKVIDNKNSPVAKDCVILQFLSFFYDFNPTNAMHNDPKSSRNVSAK